jgi:cytoskeletal protein CcmA (bactofilin family)
MGYNRLSASFGASREVIMSSVASGEFAHIGVSVTIKGELSGSEDIYVDGRVEGSIQLSGNSLTIGPNGRIRANVTARNVTIAGTLDGNIQASERTELRKTAVVNGDVQTRRIAIEEGAYFRGKLEITGERKAENAGALAASVASAATVPSLATAEEKK